jgi:hypothetical protein
LELSIVVLNLDKNLGIDEREYFLYWQYDPVHHLPLCGDVWILKVPSLALINADGISPEKEEGLFGDR